MENKCLKCNGEVVEGKIYNQVDYMNPPAHFRPNNVPLYSVLTKNAPMANSFFACPACGFLWAKVDSQQLQRCLPKKKAL